MEQSHSTVVTGGDVKQRSIAVKYSVRHLIREGMQRRLALSVTIPKVSTMFQEDTTGIVTLGKCDG